MDNAPRYEIAPNQGQLSETLPYAVGYISGTFDHLVSLHDSEASALAFCTLMNEALEAIPHLEQLSILEEAAEAAKAKQGRATQ
ncbi:MAG: hypothetical protein OQL08_01430 [Gammaproteobacteria bacterium]|nr:hypothetical protein [Gammaproteobacteria bacterium]